MPTKENNCQCGVCQVEHDLLDSLDGAALRQCANGLRRRFAKAITHRSASNRKLNQIPLPAANYAGF